MGIMEIILISVGLSLDVFVAVAYIGAGFSKIKKKNLAGLSLLFGTMQLLALLVGNTITLIPVLQKSHSQAIADRWEMLSALIFAGIGLYMISKAVKKEQVLEKRRDTINWRSTAILAVLTSVDAFFAGIGFGFLETRVILSAVLLFSVTILEAILGIYAGYRLGLVHNQKAYWIGGALLLIAGSDVAIHFCM